MRFRRPRNPVPVRWRDPVIAVVWLVALEVENLAVNDGLRSVLGYGLVAAVMGAAAFWRRRAPLTFALVALTADSILVAGWSNINVNVAPLYAQAFVPYTIATECPGARARFGLAAVLAWGIAVDVATGSPTAGAIAGLIITGACWGAGRWLRARRLLDAELARNTEQIEAERASRVRLAVADERTRIARELHTLIATNVSAMVLQAEAAELLMDVDSGAAEVAMAAIEHTGRDALDDMRRMLGVLRHSDETPSLSPQPGVGQVYALVEAARARGGSIEFSVDGDPGPLPASVDLGVYRMLEETLAAEGLERSVVRLRFRDDEVELEVSAYGLDDSSPWPTLAMRERTAICQGTIHGESGSVARRLVVTLPRRLAEVFA
jgi:signal transduction histidine kinase